MKKPFSRKNEMMASVWPAATARASARVRTSTRVHAPPPAQTRTDAPQALCIRPAKCGSKFTRAHWCVRDRSLGFKAWESSAERRESRGCWARCFARQWSYHAYIAPIHLASRTWTHARAYRGQFGHASLGAARGFAPAKARSRGRPAGLLSAPRACIGLYYEARPLHSACTLQTLTSNVPGGSDSVTHGVSTQVQTSTSWGQAGAGPAWPGEARGSRGRAPLSGKRAASAAFVTPRFRAHSRNSECPGPPGPVLGAGFFYLPGSREQHRPGLACRSPRATLRLRYPPPRAPPAVWAADQL
jgi:hypothetical protein